jgi:ectoine hydroxylase
MTKGMTTDLYASRAAQSVELTERRDPVVWGSSEGLLSPTELELYEANGFIIRESLFGQDEIQAVMREVERLPSRYVGRPAGEVETDPDSGAVRSIFRVHSTVPAVRRLARDPRVVDVAEQILDSEVYVHMSCIRFKRAFDPSSVPWRSDFETWHIEDGMPHMRAITAAPMLTDSTPSNGPLMLIPGSHQFYVPCLGRASNETSEASLRNARSTTPPADVLALLTQRAEPIQVLGPAGSVVFYDGNVMHGSPGNMSQFPLHHVFLAFNSVENPLHAPCWGLSPRPLFLADRSGRPDDDSGV